MGNPKQKWTPEEEAALRAGVDKHGAGKWRTIQKDPEFQTVLNHRSNVDLKDKWRNMNVGLSGHGSREKLPKSHSKLKGSDECMSPVPMGALSGDVSAEDAHGNADTLVSSDSSKDRKLLDHRYTELVISAISELKEPNGCGTTAIASYIEVIRLLSSKLRDMVSQGNLLKVKQNYKINTTDPLFRNEGMAGLVHDDRREIYQGMGRAHDYDSATMRLSQDASSSDFAKRKFRGGPAPRFDLDVAKLKIKTAQEAARAAAVAVAEAEATAAAAEKAAKEAEAAEAEAEAAELAVELAAIAARNPKKVCRVPFRVEDVAITV
ncbi:hypothetical protein L7F22_001613 [Adiantum nelumboides]|nr:hypothetical protein [Adiantum nelumboides]